jgi:hypothetical protein
LQARWPQHLWPWQEQPCWWWWSQWRHQLDVSSVHVARALVLLQPLHPSGPCVARLFIWQCWPPRACSLYVLVSVQHLLCSVVDARCTTAGVHPVGSSTLIAALNNMAPPSQAGWVIDSGVTFHMSSDNGTVPPLLPLPYLVYATVGNGARVLVHFYNNMHPCLPSSNFVLKSVLRVLSLIQNLLSVDQFTRDNAVSIEFDPLGFLLRTSRPDARSFTAIARATSTPSLEHRSHHNTKLSSPV